MRCWKKCRAGFPTSVTGYNLAWKRGRKQFRDLHLQPGGFNPEDWTGPPSAHQVGGWAVVGNVYLGEAMAPR
jgi:hypothetical protein